MSTLFADAIVTFRENDFAQFEKLIKQNPQLIEIKRRGRSLLTFALLYDRLRFVQLLLKKSPRFLTSEENAEAAVRWAIQADARRCAKYLLNLPRSAHETPWILLKNRRQVTPIHLAAKYGHVKILKMLLQSSAVENASFYEFVQDEIGQSPLHYAAGAGKVECCEVLLDDRLGLPIDQKDNNGHAPLMCAAASCYPGAEKVVRLLGSRKISSITARDNAGRTALHLAVIAQNVTVVNVILNELSCPAETFDNDARTPLHYAAQRGLLDMVEMLLAASARNATRDCFGVSPAHYAAQGGHRQIVDRLVTSAGGAEQFDSDGRSCFMWAIIADKEEMAKHLLSVGNPDRTYRDQYGYTALHHAAHTGSQRLVKLLVKEGWNIHDEDSAGATPLHLAAGKGHTSVVRILVMVGANCEHPDRYRRTPIFYACLGGQAHTLKVMVTELNCKVSHVDNLGRTAAHCAAFGGFTACLEVLTQTPECEIYREDIDQLTALHVACEQGKLECVKHLLLCGAAINAFSHVDDSTPLSRAQARGHRMVVDYLKRNGALFPHQLLNLAATVIQHWWRSLQNSNSVMLLPSRSGGPKKLSL